MREGWKDAKLGDVCTIVAGQSPKGSAYNNHGDGLPFHQGKKYFRETLLGDSNTWTTEITKEAFPGDILMSVRAPVGPINFTNQHMCIGRGLAAIRASERVDAMFVFHWLSYIQSEIQGSEGAVFASINKRQIESIDLPLPPLSEQKRIVAILDEAFAGIATAVANAEKNVVNARELFDAYLDVALSQEAAEWKERKLGDKSLLEIVDGDRGKNYPKKTDFHEQGHCLFMNTKNVRSDGFRFDSLMFITEDKDNALGKGKLKRRDVVLTTRGTIGNVGVYDDNVEFDHVRINSGMLVLRPNEKEILSEFLFEILRSSVVKKQIDILVSGAAQPQLPIKTLVNLSVPVPNDLALQRRIVSCLRELAVETRRLAMIYRNKLEALTELRQSLLQIAFSGGLTAARQDETENALA